MECAINRQRNPGHHRQGVPLRAQECIHARAIGYCAHPSGLRAQGWSAQPQLLCGGEVRGETEVWEAKNIEKLARLVGLA